MNASGVILFYKFCTRSFLRQLETIIDFISNGNQCVHSKFRLFILSYNTESEILIAKFLYYILVKNYSKISS